MADHSTHPQDATDASVVGIIRESKTITRLRLSIKDKSLRFKAGQWVDFFIADMSIFTGFSMCSPPGLLADTGIMELAIKFSDYPPTEWVHKQCQVGDGVHIKVSGPLFYDPSSDDPRDLLLLAAGIGINPILSIYRHYAHLDKEGAAQGNLALLYTAREWEELVFKEDILQIAAQNSKIQVQLFSTANTSDSEQNGDGSKMVAKNRRIGAEDVRDALAKLKTTRTTVFICGPSSFIDDMETFCLGIGLLQSQILYEKWW